MFDKFKKRLDAIENLYVGGEIKEKLNKGLNSLEKNSGVADIKKIINSTKKTFEDAFTDSVVKIEDDPYHLYYDPLKEKESNTEVFQGTYFYQEEKFYEYHIKNEITIPGLPKNYKPDNYLEMDIYDLVPIFEGDYPKEYSYVEGDNVLFRLVDADGDAETTMRPYDVEITAEGKKYIKDKVEAILNDRLEIDSSKEKIEVFFDKQDKVYYKYKFRQTSINMDYWKVINREKGGYIYVEYGSKQ